MIKTRPTVRLTSRPAPWAGDDVLRAGAVAHADVRVFGRMSAGYAG